MSVKLLIKYLVELNYIRVKIRTRVRFMFWAEDKGKIRVKANLLD